MTEPRFALCGPLQWRQVGDDWVVRFAHSGALAVANPVDAALLEWLADGPATAVDLAARLAAAAGVELPADTSIGIDERLRQWVDAGWIEPLDA